MCGFLTTYSYDCEYGKVFANQAAQAVELIAHRGPDGRGSWVSDDYRVCMQHCRLSIIDLETGAQPMVGVDSSVITYNGEIYNYLELRQELSAHWDFRTHSDTEVILAAYHRWGADCVRYFRGMFAFVLWDPHEQVLFCARDQFGIKPFYYVETPAGVIMASEVKPLLGFLDTIDVDQDALKEYLHFQLYLNGKTLFRGIKELPPAHSMTISRSGIKVTRYWEVFYHIDFDHTPKFFQDRLSELMHDSVRLHLRSDVPVGGYLSGGLDSSLVALMAASYSHDSAFAGFHGRFAEGQAFDESEFAREAAKHGGFELYDITISAQDFEKVIRRVIWHLDYPIAGPGSFPQFCVAKLAAQHRKVVLGGQGGDEIFGGYARYLIAYFEQCIRGAINGTLYEGNFVVTYESIIPNLKTLRGYEPLLQEFWRDGLFEPMDRRYFRLMNRARDLHHEIRWKDLGQYDPFETFAELFNSRNVGHEAYFDRMTHFDFKTLLPALLHVEDRMSMANGLESRVPFLDVPLVEFVATIPADVKFKGGKLKRLPLETFGNVLPEKIRAREDKMGFPVPVQQWFQKDLKEFVQDVFRTQSSRARDLFNTEAILSAIDSEPKYGRKIWGLLSLELWFQEFIDAPQRFKLPTK